MSRLSPSLLAVALAVACCAMPVAAQQQVTTSQGTRSLPRTEGLTTEAQLRQAARQAEDIVRELLQDVAQSESARQTVVGSAGGLTEQVKRESAELERAKAAFELIDKKYRADLADFEQRQAQLQSEIERQRTEAAALQAALATPAANTPQNNYYAESTRLNNWAAELGNRRTAIDAERARLLADHDNVEAERAKLAKQHADTEAKLKGMRDQTLGQFGSAEQKRAATYAQLRVASNYLNHVRELLRGVVKGAFEHSTVLDEAEAKLRAYDASRPGGQR